MHRILVGYDGSDHSLRALEAACRLARAFDGELTVLTAAADRLVREDGVVTPAADEELGRRTAEQGARRARETGVRQVEARTSIEAPDDALVLAAEEEFDLVVLGHRGLGALKELFLGSTAKAVVDRSRCSVLIVR